MILRTLSLQNFRNYTRQSLTFSPTTTLIIGPNTAGKTNILEALVMMATGKSFRADRDSEVVRWGVDITRLKATLEDTTLEMVITSGFLGGQKVPIKKYTVNGVPRRLVDFAGNLRTVLFWPEDLELVTDSPSLRRRYLDSVLVQTDREYRRNLLSYERGLRQRNKLLDLINEGRASSGQLLFWNQLLIRAGGYLTDMRTKLLAYVNDYTFPGVVFRTVYDKSIISDTRLQQYADEEIAAKATLVGPHRDDFIIQTKPTPVQREERGEESFLDLSKYGSRGEQRLAVLWLKLAELSYIQGTTSEPPLLLLDDIFSELDEEHQQMVLSLMGKQQTIVSSTDIGVLQLLKHAHAKHLEIIRLPLVK